ncbi:MAG: hypothetical protein J2O48_13950 [Solirubrobacterales bacterium]|nr:hypothetical protein [Solirubrobacterales bacterium]
MIDREVEPEFDTSRGGMALLAVFIVPALVIVAGVVFMAKTDAWWAVGVMFAGVLLLTGAVGVTVVEYTSREPQVVGPEAEEEAQAEQRDTAPKPRPVRHRHRIAFHH